MKKLLFFAGLSLSGCLEKSTGCLDPEAQNFAVEVDKSCDSCCQYPLLQVNIGPIWGDEGTKFSYLKTWTDAAGRPFTIDTIALYLSGFQLFNSTTGESAAIMDSVRLRVFPDTTGQFFQRDIILVRPTTETYNVGTLLVKGGFDRLRFRIGLDDGQNRAIPIYAPGGHPLRPQPEAMWDDTTGNFYFLKIRLKKDTAAGKPKTVLAWTKSRGTVEMDLPFTQNTSWKRGISPTVLLVMDYAKWFDGVDLGAGDAAILDKIIGNVKASFTLKKP